MKITVKHPIITIDYPTIKGTIFLIGVFGLQFTLIGLVVLIYVLLENPSHPVPGLTGVIFTIMGIIVIYFAMKMEQKGDQLIIDLLNDKMTRKFGLGGVYDQFSGKEFEYNLALIDELFIDRVIIHSRGQRGGLVRGYYMKCGFNDSQGSNVLLHLGGLNPVTKTIGFLAKLLKKDILDLTLKEERTIPYEQTELLETIRFRSLKFVKDLLLRFVVILVLFFLVPLVLTAISGLFPGIEGLFRGIQNLSVLGAIIALIYFPIWIYKAGSKERLKCPQCHTFYDDGDSSCSHCGMKRQNS